MKLPHLENAQIPREKVTGYLLSEEKSGGKATFFSHFGFTSGAWRQLEIALRRHAADHDVVKTISTAHGVKYVIEGAISTPDERNPVVRVVWIIEYGQTSARLVTA
ncbi:hypothetical protein GC175_03625 [bacterium]|nr:hypothetical protein [bacterium]